MQDTYTSFEEAVRETALEVAEAVIRKHRDYSPNNILKSPFGPEKGLIVRLYDKIERYRHLISNNGDCHNEPLTDTKKDIAGYAVIGLLVERGQFNLPLVEDK